MGKIDEATTDTGEGTSNQPYVRACSSSHSQELKTKAARTLDISVAEEWRIVWTPTRCVGTRHTRSSSYLKVVQAACHGACDATRYKFSGCQDTAATERASAITADRKENH